MTIIHGKAMMGNSLGKRGTSTLLEAMSLVKERGHQMRVIVFDNFEEDAGAKGLTMRHDFLRQIEARGLNHWIDIRSGIPIAKMPGVLAEASIGIIAYNREFGENSLPGRLFEYMAAAIPVIGPEYAGDVVNIVERERCGLLADCEDPASIARSLCWIIEHPAEAKEMGMRGRAAFLAKYCWEREVQPLVDKIHNWKNCQASIT